MLGIGTPLRLVIAVRDILAGVISGSDFGRSSAPAVAQCRPDAVCVSVDLADKGDLLAPQTLTRRQTSITEALRAIGLKGLSRPRRSNLSWEQCSAASAVRRASRQAPIERTRFSPRNSNNWLPPAEMIYRGRGIAL